MLHATHPMCETVSDPADLKTGCSGIEEFTCARTEVSLLFLDSFSFFFFLVCGNWIGLFWAFVTFSSFSGCF